jgi:hypothetical protein
MNFPKQIKGSVAADPNALPVVGAIFSIRLGMPSKNAHTIGPQISDESGCAAFEEDAVRDEMRLFRKVSPMDYSGKLEDCPSLEVAVPGGDDIQRLIAARKLWGQGVPEWRLHERELLALKRAQKNPVFAKALCFVVKEHLLDFEGVMRIPEATCD